MTDWTVPAHDSPAAPAADVDRALAQAAAGGGGAACEALDRRHPPRGPGGVARLVGFDRSRAEDLAQETFVKAWQALPAYRFESAFSTWLHRLAVNTALMDLRARRSRIQADGDEALEYVGMPDSAGHGTALTMDLERAVATLPPRARAVLVLYDVEGWKHEEIADALGMAIGSSKAQLHRARSLLRERLEAHA
jgi:RNA polymerase sigma-70 factor (ECF subfamily)